MAQSRLPVGSHELLEYFEQVNNSYPGQHWRNGVEMCRRWIAMQSNLALTREEVDAFLERLDSEPNPGSGWIDLG